MCRMTRYGEGADHLKLPTSNIARWYEQLAAKPKFLTADVAVRPVEEDEAQS